MPGPAKMLSMLTDKTYFNLVHIQSFNSLVQNVTIHVARHSDKHTGSSKSFIAVTEYLQPY